MTKDAAPFPAVATSKFSGDGNGNLRHHPRPDVEPDRRVSLGELPARVPFDQQSAEDDVLTPSAAEYPDLGRGRLQQPAQCNLAGTVRRGQQHDMGALVDLEVG